LSLAILNSFLLARDGEPVNVEALKTAVHSLVAAGFEPSNPDKESLELYREEAENPLIQDLKSMTSAGTIAPEAAVRIEELARGVLHPTTLPVLAQQLEG
jgi:hypothetical protein